MCEQKAAALEKQLAEALQFEDRFIQLNGQLSQARQEIESKSFLINGLTSELNTHKQALSSVQALRGQAQSLQAENYKLGEILKDRAAELERERGQAEALRK